jgi:hypothetical protein
VCVCGGGGVWWKLQGRQRKESESHRKEVHVQCRQASFSDQENAVPTHTHNKDVKEKTQGIKAGRATKGIGVREGAK